MVKRYLSRVAAPRIKEVRSKIILAMVLTARFLSFFLFVPVFTEFNFRPSLELKHTIAFWFFVFLVSSHWLFPICDLAALLTKAQFCSFIFCKQIAITNAKMPGIHQKFHDSMVPLLLHQIPIKKAIIGKCFVTSSPFLTLENSIDGVLASSSKWSVPPSVELFAQQ